MSARHEARFHLPDLLALTADPADPLGEESADAINIALADPADALAFASDLRAQVPGLLIEPTARDTGPSSTFAVIERFHFAVAVVTVVASSLFLLALMVMRVNERRETLGTLRLIGVPTRRLALHVVAEGLAVALAGHPVRAPARGDLRGRVQPLLPVALRHRAGLRAHHAVGGVALGGARGADGAAGERRRVVAAAARGGADARPPMRSLRFTWLGLVRQPGRTLLGVLGVAATGALLFDMLLLANGLVVAMEDLLDDAGFDVRVTAMEGIPFGGPRLREASHAVAAIAGLPEVAQAVPMRLGDATVSGPRGIDRDVTVIGAPAGSNAGWTLVDGRRLDDVEVPAGRPMLVNAAFARASGAAPGDGVTLRGDCGGGTRRGSAGRPSA